MPLYNPVLAGLPSGGADGQVLTKQSAANFDADWETPAGGSAGAPLQLPIQTDRYYLALGSETGAGSEAADTWEDLLVAVPFMPGADETLTRIGINCTAGAAGVTAWLGIYASGADGLPSGAPIDTAEVDLSTTGEKEGTISAAVTGGQIHWMTCSIEPSATAEIQADTINAALSFLFYGISSNQGTVKCITAAHTFGDLPNPFGAVTFEEQEAPPSMWVRKV